MNLFEKEAFAQSAATQFEAQSPEQLLAWAVEQYSNITFACSFGAEDVVLLEMINEIKPDMAIFYLDTDFHFQQTYETRDRLAQHYGITFIQVKSQWTPEQQAQQYGDELWKTNPNQCCQLRKVEPLISTLANYEAWITGIRREQSPTRAKAQKVEYDHKFGLMKFNPLADWSTEQVWTYIKEHQLIYNPLHDQHYPSIGCHYCTRQVKEGEDPRAGRWSGSDKTECGLHK